MKRTLLLLLAASSALWAMEKPTDKRTTGFPGPADKQLANKIQTASTPVPRPFVNNPAGAGITVDGLGDTIEAQTVITIQFPAEMVEADRIDAEGSRSPVAASPDLDVEFTWRTQSQGDLLIKGPLIPGQAYRFRLVDGLKNLAGEALPENEWGFEVPTNPLKITEAEYDQRDNLGARPQVPLEFNYAIRLSDAAKNIWFQDRVTRKKFAVEILLNRAEGESTGEQVVDVKEEAHDVIDFRVRPQAPLPIDHFYDLVVDGVTDDFGGQTMLYPRVFPLGTTGPITVEYVAARNFPLEKPRVEIKFAESLSDAPLPKDALTFDPPVANVKLRKEGQFLTAEGNFDTTKRYKVTISNQIVGATGYGLDKPEVWGATFHPKVSTIIFPERQIRERSVLGLSFAFYHVNTTELNWKLAPIPLDKLLEALDREQEFNTTVSNEDGSPKWTDDGILERETSELLIPALNLKPVGEGRIPASTNGSETLRELAWQPEQAGSLAGPMLLEITGKDLKGHDIANRAIIYFGDRALTRKVTKNQTIVRVARMEDAQPVAGVKVTAYDKTLKEIGSAKADAGGMAYFDTVAIPDVAYFLADGTLQPVALSDQFSSGSLSARPPPALRGYAWTDRPLYRPGQAIQFKGIVREEKDGALKIPAGSVVKWKIETAYGSDVLASGESKVNAQGGWNAAWTPPEEGPVGEFSLKVRLGEESVGEATRFQIQEYRNPPFSVLCEETKPEKPAESVVMVSSQYFHGAANVGARAQWTATWTSDSDGGEYSGTASTRVDLYSEHAKQPTYYGEATGEAALDGAGKATLRCEPPFKDPGNRANCHVSWKVDVTGPDGQTITGGVSQDVAMAPVLLGIKRGVVENGQITFDWDAEEEFAKAPQAVNVQLYHVVTKTAKERLAPDVYRYRNFDQYEPVEKRDRVTDSSMVFQPKSPGRYVAVVSPLPGEPGFPVSEEAFVEGPEASEVPVQSDTAATVLSVKGRSEGKARPWMVGEKAVLNVLAPTGGVAWVSVETDRIHDTFTVPLEGNTSKIEIPVKPEYEPNVYVSVYLLRPGGTHQLAGEMFGYDELYVMKPGRVLNVAVTTSQPEYEPREKISGEVAVTADGRPVAGADLAIYAVDDSILTLGGWKMPEMLESFFPEESYGVVTYSALKAYVDKVSPSWLTMKGFVVGDGGDEEFGNTTFERKDFKPIILWKPSVITDAKGIAKFDCTAPDNLTRFRVIAVGQTKDSQFGGGDSTLTVSKKLMIDPSLPRFLREGDEVELRAVVRQKASENETLKVRCTVGGNLELIETADREITTAKDAPVVVKFKARAKAVGASTVKFQVMAPNQPKLADSVEIPVPIAEPVILKKEAVAGDITEPIFTPKDVMPAAWKDGYGTFSLSISTTPWLSKLMGLPYLLEYPHGCFEQKSSRLLAYTYLGGLLAYLPNPEGRKANYQGVMADIFNEFETGLLPDGGLPYWPSDTAQNDYVTIQAAWCAKQAEAGGFEVPERVANDLVQAMENMVTGDARTHVSPTLRAFALFVMTMSKTDAPENMVAAADELYLQRDKLTGEGRAMLALSMNRLKVTPDKQKKLASELPKSYQDIAFNPTTFCSATRTEALCTWARLQITPDDQPKLLRERLSKLMESSASLSTQENLWLLVAFNALMKSSPLVPMPGVTPKTNAVAANGSAAAWTKQDLAKLADFAAKGLKAQGSYVLQASYRTPEKTTPLVVHGMKIERVVKNLTDATRVGSTEKPFKLGDQILISYRFSSDKEQSYVALTDMIPAGLEVVNPNLALFGKAYSLPEELGMATAGLSHSEIRDQQTTLYFDQLSAGSTSYSVLARATAAGGFTWPATTIEPMYDSRFYGQSPSSSCAVSSE
ncbi:hypothetical protein BH09VER1_BH09VER1_00640 [soil metagenome]